MIRRNHGSREEAIRTALRAGYWPISRRDGLWVLRRDDGSEVAVAREERARSQVWHLVDPPEDSTEVIQ